VIVNPLEDLAAICGAETPEELWLYLAATPTLRAFPHDFDAVAAFTTLHGDGTPEAVRTAGLLCTDLRWRRCTTTLIGRVEDSGILTASELDELAEGWLWDDRYYWSVPQGWLRRSRRLGGQAQRHGSGDVAIERHIWPPLRRWSACRIATENPGRSGEVLQRIAMLDSRAGDAAMTGLLDAAGGFFDEARGVLVELGCEWRNGSVRLRALEMLSLDDPERASILASTDPSGVVRRRADRLARGSLITDDDPDEVAGLIQSDQGPVSLQLTMFS
jgi:hypothetical protein